MERDYSGLEKRLLLVLAFASIVIIAGFAYLFFENAQNQVVPPAPGLIGVINVDGPIISVEGTEAVVDAIDEAISNSSIAGVIIKIDSPGGYAHLIEQIYLDVVALNEEKPVVASVVTALSGGYYIAVGADYIYTNPSSMVGNVGVIGVAPEGHTPSERSVESGPYKVTGFSRLLFPFNISEVLESFAGAVEEGRGDRLKVPGSTLRRGTIYMGTEAVDAGLADEVGALQAAAVHVAEEAGIEAFTLVDLIPPEDTGDGLTTLPAEAKISWRDLTIPMLNELNPPPAIYYLYLPEQAYRLQDDSEVATSTGDDGETGLTKKGRVVVDLSHLNQVPANAFHLLSAELAMRGVYTAYGDTWGEVEEALDQAACLIVAAPTTPYTFEEFEVINEFVRKGRLLLLFYDPASEYNDAEAPLQPVNSLANRFGLTFGQGYLYNEGERYGLYRNIYVRIFGEANITRGLETLVLFTSTYLHSTDSDAAWTRSDTYSSSSEQQGRYAPISVLAKGNGTTAAFGDITFITEPYAYLEDNYDLIMNLVTEITAIRVPVVVEPDEPEEPPHNITEPQLPVGTVKKFTEIIDGEESEMTWIYSKETEIIVDRPDRITYYTLDEDGLLVGWRSNSVEQVFDEPLPDLPYPLTESEGWTYRVGYNLSYVDTNLRGVFESRGQVVGFEYVETGDGESYWCAKISLMETDTLDREEDILTIEVTELIWVSHEAGMVKSEADVSYYIDDLIALEESRSLLLLSIELGQD